MDDDCCELLRCCCECGLCIGLCCLCCKDNDDRRRDPYYQGGPQVTVTTQPIPQPYPQHAGPPGNYGSPYPNSMPMPPQPGYPQNAAPYPPTTYPPGPPGAYPPGPPGGTPYPPAGPPTGYLPQTGYQSQPPPYDVAMSMPPVQPPPQPEAYVKQAPYNPHFQG